MSNAELAYKYYIGAGLSQYAAAALTGHGYAESKFDPNAIGDSGASFGINQWQGSRKTALFAYARSRGETIPSFKTQLEFTVRELRTSENGAFNQLQRARNITDAVKAGMGYFRPAGWSRDNPEGGHNYSGRLAAANTFLSGSGGADDLLGGTITPETEPTFWDYLMRFMSGVSGVSPSDGGVMPDQNITQGEYSTDIIYDTLKAIAVPAFVILLAILFVIVGGMSFLTSSTPMRSAPNG